MMRSRVSAARSRRTLLSYGRRSRADSSAVTVSRRHDGECFVAAHCRCLRDLGAIEFHVPLGEPRQHLIQRDAAFEARERRAEAEVDAVPEREVLVDLAVDVEAIGILEVALVAVRGADEEHHHAALGDGLAVYLDLRRHVAADLRA